MFEKTNPDIEECHTFSQRQALKKCNSLLEENEPRDLIDTLDLESLLKGTESPIESTQAIPKSSLKKTSSLYPAPSSNRGVANFLKMTC